MNTSTEERCSELAKGLNGIRILGSTKGMADGEEKLPRDAKIVKTLLKSMGVENYEPRVVHQFLELWYRYVVDVLTDAQVYSEHAGKSSIDSDDVKLAIQNKIPLPKSIAGPGMALPPEPDTLINPNYQLVILKKRTSEAVEETEEEEEASESKSQDQRTDVPQTTPQRVSFPLGPKRAR
ncbi:Histone-fold [Cynara cardunculus var. scolymus]|uniref:Histone-fold n=1 Tax=Cynara cardunculus var. scolymus TaxID=59895 RepID=A0A124SC18_CYNCS|nr:Histone-fold [Cynara cardunculus var. scolymus]